MLRAALLSHRVFDPMERPFDRAVPRVLVYEVDELPIAPPLARLLGVSERIRAAPFYVYDARFKGRVVLPPEPPFEAQEDALGTAFAKAIARACGYGLASRGVLDASGQYLSWVVGWHNSLTREGLRRVYEELGFDVARMAEIVASRPLMTQRSYGLGQLSNDLRRGRFAGVDPDSDVAAIDFAVSGAGEPRVASRPICRELARYLIDHRAWSPVDDRILEVLRASDALHLAVLAAETDWWESHETAVFPALASRGVSRVEYLRSLALARTADRQRSRLESDTGNWAVELLLGADELLAAIGEGPPDILRTVHGVLRKVRSALAQEFPDVLRLLKEDRHANVKWHALRALHRHPAPEAAEGLAAYVRSVLKSGRPPKELGTLPLIAPTMEEIGRLSARRGADDKTELVFALETLEALGVLRGSALATVLRRSWDRLYASEQAYIAEHLPELQGNSTPRFSG